MSKYFSGKKGQYIYCDICGQPCYAFEAKLLSAETGRGGLLVCPNDRDKIDFGLMDYTIPVERHIPVSRINHQNVTNGSEPIDVETSTELGV